MSLADRTRTLGPTTARRHGRYVLHVATCFRRAHDHPGLALAGELARGAGLPVVACDVLSDAYEHASVRFHAFIVDGVREVRAALAAEGVRHVFLWTRERSVLRDRAFEKLLAGAAHVVVDDSPVGFQPGLVARLAARGDVPVHAVDAFGLFPASAFPKEEVGARTLRPKIARALPFALARPLYELGPTEPSLGLDLGLEEGDLDPDTIARELASRPIDHTVRPVPGRTGGLASARAELARFLADRLPGYAERRNDPAVAGTSSLSPWLHFGQLSAAEVARAVERSSAARRDKDAFLEQLVVRRELALNLCVRNPAFRTTDALPRWARETLGARPRPRATYSLEELDAAATEDELWNAAQVELATRGSIHGYVRMLWGKKIVEWAPDAATALAWMAHLNDRWALDGRDPVSWANFLWCLGKHDRPFPARPGFGQVRSMSSRATARKFRIESYLDRVAEGACADGTREARLSAS